MSGTMLLCYTAHHTDTQNRKTDEPYLHCCGRCGSAWAAGLRYCQNLHSAPAAADIHSHHTPGANSSTHSTL